MSAPVRTNDEWLAALSAGDDAAWAAIHDRIRGGLHAYLAAHRPAQMADDEIRCLAEETAQESVITVRAKLSTFRNESRFTTWVYRIAINMLLGELRRRGWQRRVMTSLDMPTLDAVPAGAALDPERGVLQRELWDLVLRLVDQELTPYQRNIVIAHGFHGKPLDLVAADLGVSRDAVYKVLHDARRKLRAALLARGVTLRDAFRAFEP